MDLYRQQILDHYKHPHNFGHLKNPDVSKTLFNSACGDKITMEVRFGKDKKTVEDIRFSGVGCAVSMASASLLTDRVKRMKREAVLKLDKTAVLDLLEMALTPTRTKCALLPLETLQKAIRG